MNQTILVSLLLLGSVGAAAQPAEAPGRSRYALPPGRVQVGVLVGGTSYHQFITRTRPTAAGEILVGLPHNFALYGDVAGSDGNGLEVPWVHVTADFHTFGGGLHWSIPNRTRFVPYLRGGASRIHTNAGARIARSFFGVERNRTAGTFGGGVKVHLMNNFGVLLDLQLSGAPDMAWLARTSFGIFYQFK